MKHLGTKQLETERLILRRFRVSDAQAMYENWARDSEVTKYLTWPAHRGPEVSEAVLSAWAKDYAQVGVNRVECRHDSNNPHSGMVMKKCGMRYEGTLRQADRNNQGLCDACMYGLLRSDRVRSAETD